MYLVRWECVKIFQSLQNPYFLSIKPVRLNNFVRDLVILCVFVNFLMNRMGECSICTEALEQNVAALPCGHTFHHFCASKWLEVGFMLGPYKKPLKNAMRIKFPPMRFFPWEKSFQESGSTILKAKNTFPCLVCKKPFKNWKRHFRLIFDQFLYFLTQNFGSCTSQKYRFGDLSWNLSFC